MFRKLFNVVLVAGLLGAAIVPAATASGFAPLRTVERVDLSRYAGRWYEIARLPNRFQKHCGESTAVYSLRDDGELDVVNSCRNGKDGTVKQAKGRAWVVDPASNARLKVTFFWPFRGDYWIMELGRGYEYAVVGTPDRKYLWVLSRVAIMEEELYTAIMQRAEQQGFDIKKVLRGIPAKPAYHNNAPPLRMSSGARSVFST